MIPVPVQSGDLVACRLKGRATVVLGIKAASLVEGAELVLRFPAELRAHSFMAANPLTRQTELRIAPFLFFLALPEESFAWSELASVHVLRDADLDTRFDYARQVLADYRQNVARWNAEAVRVPVRRVEAG